MDARDQLRRYLEQRRDLGERELMLDELSVDDVMRVLGARPTPASEVRACAVAPPTPQALADAPPSDPRSVESAEDNSVDWRSVLEKSDAKPGPPQARPSDTPRPRSPRDVGPASEHVAPPRPVAVQPPSPGGGARSAVPAAGTAPIIVGATGRELFGGPTSELASLDAMEKAVAECQRCPLYATAKNPVPGEGNPNADLVCVGEAPGATEDETGRPFVGESGQLLTKILGAINLRREDVFICNVLKHRPPGNRNPAPTEVAACSPYLVRQLELIQPKVVIAFGTFAAQTLLDTKLSLGKLRGTVHKYYGIPLIVTYHPAALLRNPAWKRPTWEDVQLARRIFDRASGA